MSKPTQAVISTSQAFTILNHAEPDFSVLAQFIKDIRIIGGDVTYIHFMIPAAFPLLLDFKKFRQKWSFDVLLELLPGTTEGSRMVKKMANSNKSIQLWRKREGEKTLLKG